MNNYFANGATTIDSKTRNATLSPPTYINYNLYKSMEIIRGIICITISATRVQFQT